MKEAIVDPKTMARSLESVFTLGRFDYPCECAIWLVRMRSPEHYSIPNEISQIVYCRIIVCEGQLLHRDVLPHVLLVGCARKRSDALALCELVHHLFGCRVVYLSELQYCRVAEQRRGARERPKRPARR